jgi:hypothetical protein
VIRLPSLLGHDDTNQRIVARLHREVTMLIAASIGWSTTPVPSTLTVSNSDDAVNSLAWLAQARTYLTGVCTWSKSDAALFCISYSSMINDVTHTRASDSSSIEAALILDEAKHNEIIQQLNDLADKVHYHKAPVAVDTLQRQRQLLIHQWYDITKRLRDQCIVRKIAVQAIDAIY